MFTAGEEAAGMGLVTRAPAVLVSTAGTVSEVRAPRVPRPVSGLVDMAWGGGRSDRWGGGDRIGGGGGQDRRSYLIPSKQKEFAEMPHPGAISCYVYIVYKVGLQYLQGKQYLNKKRNRINLEIRC
jgi:hypothetical protein